MAMSVHDFNFGGAKHGASVGSLLAALATESSGSPLAALVPESFCYTCLASIALGQVEQLSLLDCLMVILVIVIISAGYSGFVRDWIRRLL